MMILPFQTGHPGARTWRDRSTCPFFLLLSFVITSFFANVKNFANVQIYSTLSRFAKDDDSCRLDNISLPYRDQADLDLEPWRIEGISEEFLQASASWYRNQSAKLGHLFHIRSNQIYVSFASKEEEEIFTVRHATKYPNASPRSRGMLSLLLLYTCFVELPDLDGFITFDDRAPGRSKYGSDGGVQIFEGLPMPPPFFTFQKKTNEIGVLLPWYSHAEFNAQMFGDQARKDHPWQSKEDQIFWRGSATGGVYRNDTWRKMPRTMLVMLCREEGLCNETGFTSFLQTENVNFTSFLEKTLGVKPAVPLMDQMHYKYLPLLNGNGPCAGRSEKFFSGNSLIFKEDSQHIEFYYRGLHPNKHYIPIHRNMSNVKEQLKWAREHDAEAEKIVSNMNEFAKSIHPASVACYIRELLVKYAKLLRYTPKPIAEFGPHVHQVFPVKPQKAYPRYCSNSIFPCNVTGLGRVGRVYYNSNVQEKREQCQWSNKRH